MSGSPADQMKARKRYLKSICSPSLANYIVYDRTLSWKYKMKVLEIARKIAFSKGRLRVWLEDWYEALREFRKDVKK